MNFKQWLDRYNKEPFDYPPNARDGWYACKNEILKTIKDTKAPKVAGREGLGGYEWLDMDAETFRDLLVKKIEKL